MPETETQQVDNALDHADWWTGGAAIQGEMTTTETMRILAAEVRRLREIVGESE